MKKNIITIILILFVFFNVKSQLVQPEFEDGKYKLSAQDIYFEIDPEFGARITSYMLDDEEIILPQSFGVIMGSTFWPSPQSVWGWPPPLSLNEYPYTGGINNKKIWLTSEVDPFTDLSFSKIAFANLADTSITLSYVMINHSDETQTYAPWEVSRVSAKGTVFFPAGDEVVFGNMSSNSEVIDDYVWFNPSNVEGNKFFSDSKGWLAYVDENSNLFIKIFEDIPADKAAPNEAEVEIFVGGEVMELENQGAYTEIPTNDSLVWTVKWFVRKLPEDIDIKFGSNDLIAFTINVIDNSAPNPQVPIHNTPNLELELYPNPSSNKILIANKTFNNNAYKIFNTNGKLVKEGKLMNQTIDITGLINGLYTIYISNDTGSFKGLFVKK